MKTKTNLLLLGLIFTLALIFRFYRLNSYPPLLWDEAAIGYNAYSLLLTGKDEHGQFLPLIFKSFGDFKPGLYIYLTVPFVALFGLNPLSVRLPSALLGAVSVLLLFRLIRQLKLPPVLAYMTAGLLAITPLSIHFSRGGWETNLLTFLLLLFSSLFSQKKYLLSAIVAGLSLYSYQAAKVITPLVIFINLIAFPPKFTKLNILRFLLPLLLISIPLVVGLLGSDSSRLKVVSLFSYPPTVSEINQLKSESGPLDYLLFHSTPFHFVSQFLSRYFNHFSPQFLFTQGDWPNPRHSAPYLGLLLLPSVVLLPLGLFSGFRFVPPKVFLFFLLWLLFAPVPSSLTRDSVSAVRSQSLVIPLVFFMALGLSLFIKLKSILLKSVSISFIVFGFLVGLIFYFDSYYHHLVRVAPFDWLYGNAQAARLVSQNVSRFRHIYFSDFYGQPYIYYLFYSLYPPAAYQSASRLVQTGPDTGRVAQLDNIKFGSIDFNFIRNQPSTLAVISYDEVMRQGIDLSLLKPISPVNNLSTYYVYQNL